ncbi:UNVERIFIED_CONTAM: GNAT superfamily N-acetyltransferase [Paenibacillus sp. PvR008]
MKQRYDRIVVFVMDSKHRNKGIGKALNQEAEAWAREWFGLKLYLIRISWGIMMARRYPFLYFAV